MKRLYQIVEFVLIAASGVGIFNNMMPEATFLLVLAMFSTVLRIERGLRDD